MVQFIYAIFLQVGLNKLECREKVFLILILYFFFQKVKLSYILD